MEVSPNNYHFKGYVTKYGVPCSDGRTITPDAFKHHDGAILPLVWNHQHNDVNNVLGKVLLHNCGDGMYGYGLFNDTESGNAAKALVEHGDIVSMSICANQLKHNSNRGVTHGRLCEVSLVLAGANPGAFIDTVMKHGEECEDEAVIYSGEDLILCHSDEDKLEHSDNDKDNNSETKESTKEKKEDSNPENEKSIKDVYESMSAEQKTVLHYMLSMALDDSDDDSAEHSEINEGDDVMKNNVFDQEEVTKTNTLSHSEMETIIGDAKRYGSIKESFLAHAAEYGIDQIDWLFPEAKTLNNPPEFIKRDTGWVSVVMNGTHHTPFSRIKSVFANITEDEARAKGYIKGNLKKEEVFSLLKRTTTPCTIYKKQKLDRDDVVDITDFDVIAWLKSEMRMMLDEEIARAILIGDGRLASSDDKINESNIRPIAKDAELYTIRQLVSVASNATADDKAKAMIKAAVKARKNYKGSGNPTFFTTEDWLTDALLLEDTQGHRLYKNDSEVAAAMRVSKIVTVPVMEGAKGPNGKDLIGVIVNLADYNIGADKGGAVSMFDDFDIDYNQMKYLIETRCSGALTKPYSAITLELDVAG